MSNFGDITITTMTPGTAATNLGKAEDAAASSGDTGVVFLAVRQDGNDTAQTSNSGDYTAITTNDVGNIKTQIEPSRKATYVGSTAFFTPAASATDMWQLYGSASKTVKVLKIFLVYKTTSITSSNDFFLLKRSTANTSGTAVNTTIGKFDSTNSAATAVAKHYTANPTTGSLDHQIMVTSTGTTSFANSTSGSSISMLPSMTLFDADKFGQPIVLRGTGEGVVLNNNGVTVANSGSLSVTVVFTEE